VQVNAELKALKFDPTPSFYEFCSNLYDDVMPSDADEVDVHAIAPHKAPITYLAQSRGDIPNATPYDSDASPSAVAAAVAQRIAELTNTGALDVIDQSDRHELLAWVITLEQSTAALLAVARRISTMESSGALDALEDHNRRELASFITILSQTAWQVQPPGRRQMARMVRP
jgi:hypothetical protein